jgi:hypothetical protein
MSKRTLTHEVEETGKWQKDLILLIRNIVDLGNELQDDHATSKTAVDEIETLIEEMHDDSGTYSTWDTEVDGDLDDINDYLHYMNDRDGVTGGDFVITAGANVTLTGAGRVYYRIAGINYVADVDTTIVLEDGGDITGSNVGAWRILIDAAGTVTTQDPAGSGAQAFANVEDALLSLSQRAITANTIEIGYFVITAATGFSPNADNVNGEASEAVYTVHGPRLQCGLNAALGATGFAADNGVATWDTAGTIDARITGKVASNVIRSGNLVQISAITNQVMDDADTVDVNDFGGWLMVTDEAGTGVYALASNGIAGAVTAMTHTTAALRNTALDEVQDRLPAIFAPLARILLNNVSGGNAWEATTDNWDHDTAVATVENYTFGVFQRATVVGDVGRNAPAIPATVSAPLTPQVSSPKPASGPGTLTNATNLVLTKG